MLYLGFAAGLRASELVGLRVDEIELDGPYPSIVVRGKGLSPPVRQGATFSGISGGQGTSIFGGAGGEAPCLSGWVGSSWAAREVRRPRSRSARREGAHLVAFPALERKNISPSEAPHRREINPLPDREGTPTPR